VPEVAGVLGTSLDVAEIFDHLAAAVRTVLDFDIRATRLLESERRFEKGGAARAISIVPAGDHAKASAVRCGAALCRMDQCAVWD
jgi:hypothetical protein